MTLTGDTFTKLPTGYIAFKGRPMAYWLPRGVDVDVVEVISDSHPTNDDSADDADDSVNDLTDEPRHDPVAGGQPKGHQE